MLNFFDFLPWVVLLIGSLISLGLAIRAHRKENR